MLHFAYGSAQVASYLMEPSHLGTGAFQNLAIWTISEYEFQLVPGEERKPPLMLRVRSRSRFKTLYSKIPCFIVAFGRE